MKGWIVILFLWAGPLAGQSLNHWELWMTHHNLIYTHGDAAPTLENETITILNNGSKPLEVSILSLDYVYGTLRDTLGIDVVYTENLHHVDPVEDGAFSIPGKMMVGAKDTLDLIFAFEPFRLENGYRQPEQGFRLTYSVAGKTYTSFGLVDVMREEPAPIWIDDAPAPED